MKPQNAEIGNRLKEIRKDLNLHQHQFCQLFDISQSNYCRLERGFVDITPTNLKTLYEKYNVSVEWLIIGEGEKYKKKQIPNQKREDKMDIEYPLIKKIMEIPIQTERRYYVPKYLQPFTKEIAAFAQMDQCAVFLFAKSTLLRDMLVKTFEPEQIDYRYVNFRPLPWVTNKNSKQDIIHIPDLMKLDRQDPMLQSLRDYFCCQMKSLLIIPIYCYQKNIGSIILLTESKPHLFTPGEIDILKQASAHLTTSLEKMIIQQAIDNRKKILNCITRYHQLLKQDEAQNKKPDIIAEVLQKVFYLKSVYIMKKNNTRGNRWYAADIKENGENGEIESESGTFNDSAFEFMLEEAKKDRPDFVDVPIKDTDNVIGKLFIDYWWRENDQLFKNEINKLLLGIADALAELMYL